MGRFVSDDGRVGGHCGGYRIYMYIDRDNDITLQLVNGAHQPELVIDMQIVSLTI